MNGLLDYHWYVHDSGYQIIERKGDEYIVPIDPAGPKKTYDLSDKKSLFLEFVPYSKFSFYSIINKDPDYNHFILFANKYGLLTDSLGFTGEPIIEWVDNFKNLGISLGCYELIKHAKDSLDPNKAKILIRELPTVSGKQLEHGELRMSSIDVTKSNAEFAQKLELEYGRVVGRSIAPPNSDLEATYQFLAWAINEKLEDSISTKVFTNKFNTGLEIHSCPKNLAASIWIQFAQAVSNNLEFKQCAACSTFFEIKAKKRKNERIYCSDRCRKRIGARRAREKTK